MLEFSEIMLTKEEMKALKKLLDSPVQVEQCNQTVYERLEHYGFVCFRGSRSDPLTYSANITTCGRDYLAFRAGLRRSKRGAFLHDLVLLLIGSAFTLLVEHFGEILAWIKGLV